MVVKKINIEIAREFIEQTIFDFEEFKIDYMPENTLASLGDSLFKFIEQAVSERYSPEELYEPHQLKESLERVGY